MYYLVGGAGYRNFGDELMVKCWLDHLAGTSNAEITIDGAVEEKLDDTFRLDYPRLGITDLMNRLSRVGEESDFWTAVIRGLEFERRGGFSAYEHLKEKMDKLLSAQVIHLHGGGYLNKHFSRKGFLLGCVVAVARRSGARLIATGIGLTPLDPPTREQRDRMGDWLSQFELFETRDKQSAELLASLFDTDNVVSGLDDTFLGEMPYADDGYHRLHLSWDEGQMAEPAFERIKQYLDNHADRYDQMVFWECAPNDAGTWRFLKKNYPNMARMGFDRLVYGPLPIRPGDHMLTARFHPHFIGARAGAVGGYFSPGQYYDVKHGSVVECGSGFFPIKDAPLSPKDFDGCKNTLVDTQQSFITRKSDLANTLYSSDTRVANV